MLWTLSLRSRVTKQWLSSRPCAGISWHGKTGPAKTYEANTAAKNRFFDIVEPMGVALAQQVRGDKAMDSSLDPFDFALRASLRVTSPN